uniref:ARAD1D30558p n=1 Tax=Blastobotrys adeninivorans TaxID=409370 RepID=A0A060TBD4_BLAAD
MLFPLTIVALVAIVAYQANNIVGRIPSSLGYGVLFHRISFWDLHIGQYDEAPMLNSDHCKVTHEYMGDCEDFHINADGTIYLACADMEDRKHYFPPSNRHNYDQVPNKPIHDKFWLYDPSSDSTTQLTIKFKEGSDMDYVSHGFNVLEQEDGVRKIFAINHKHDGSVVSVFQHVPGDSYVSHLYDVSDDLLFNPNEVVATGPSSFYFTNDRMFRSGLMRFLEDKAGPWAWSYVGHCTFDVSGDSNDVSTTCSIKAHHFTYANGIAIKDNNVFVDDSIKGTVSVYTYDADDDYNLTFVQEVPIGAALDNIHVSPTTGNLVVACFPKTMATLKRLHSPTKTDLRVDAMAAEVFKGPNGWEARPLYRDDGRYISVMTNANVADGKFYGSGVLENGLLICSI